MKARLAVVAVLVMASSAHAGKAAAADPIMALEEVRPGMRCTALSVVRGTAIAEFDAEVIDVIRGDPASSGPRILFRVSGPAVDATGIGSGFSGSPIYCPDAAGMRRNAGAISEGIGEYGNKVGLATPIELILGESARPPRGARRAPGLLRRARRIATPLTVSGLSGPMRAALRRASRRAGRPALAAPSGPFLGYERQDLRPGAAVSTGFSSGDVGIGAIGTVTYRDGASVWAFGHPLDNFGPRSLLLQDAYVFTVVNNPVGFEGAGTYKLATAGHTVGALTNDTLNAVVGRMGPPPRTVPVTVSVRNSDTGRTRVLRSHATDERSLELGSALELVSSLSLGQGLVEALGADPPRVSVSMCLRIHVARRERALGFCDEYLEGGGAYDDLSAALLLVDEFKFGRLTPESVRVRARVSIGASEAFLIGARGPASARPGERIPIRLRLRRSRGGIFAKRFTYRVPPSTKPGTRVLKLRGITDEALLEGTEDILSLLLDDLHTERTGQAGPRSVDALARLIARLGRPDGVRATFARRGRGPVVLRTPQLAIRGIARLELKVVRSPR